jgi:release factor glutamine methyltransferase
LSRPCLGGKPGRHPGLELGNAERLANVVECPQFERAHHGAVVVHRREEKDGEGGFLGTPAMEDVESQHPGHQLIEDGQVDMTRLSGFVGSGAVASLDDLVAVGLEVAAKEQSDGGRVVGDEDACHRGRVWHHFGVTNAFSRLPAHEQRRLRALGRPDVESLATRRLAGEPLQYIEGTAAFTDFDVVVDARVLVPRPETEGLFELASKSVRDPAVIVDLGTGSGVLAIALARRFPDAEVHATDLSAEALELARSNADSLGAEIRFHLGDLFNPLPERVAGRVDLMVSNPPYVAESEWESLPTDVRREPRSSLVAGPLGTEVLRRIAAGAGEWLTPEAVLACEIGEDQAGALIPTFAPLGSVEIHPDLAGRVRYLLVRRT